jgi:peptidoglycan/LPS O-acetylase OafA/YrhL
MRTIDCNALRPDADAVERTNNFDAMRFWAALAVLWSHAFPLSEGNEEHEPLFALSRGQTTFGGVAVTCFFVISGYLVTQSFERSNSPWLFLKARVLRIMPALLVLLFLLAFVLGPLTSTLPLREYLGSHLPYRYVAWQGSFFRFVDGLPGVFSANPTSQVNGSLWTLRHEVECYALVFLLGVAGLWNRYVTLALYVMGVIGLALLDQNVSHGELALPIRPAHFDLATKFLAGAVVYQWRLALKANVAWVCFIGCLACVLLGNLSSAQRTLVPYCLMYLAIGTPLRWPKLIESGDLSYGMYIYAWPVKQLVVMQTATPHWFTTASVATPLVLGLAWLSWHGVEKTALALKRRTVRTQPSLIGLIGPARLAASPLSVQPQPCTDGTQCALIGAESAPRFRETAG